MIANFGYSGFSYVGTLFFSCLPVCLSVYDCDVRGTGTSPPLGEAQGKELQPLLGTLVFLLYVHTCFFLVLFVLSGVVFDFKMKGSGTSTPPGEAQGKELQPLLGTLVFLLYVHTFFFLVLSCFVRGSV